MKTRSTHIVLGAMLCVSAANVNAAEEKAIHRLGIIAVTVTPEHVRDKKVPFQFEITPGDGATLSLSVFIGPATKEFGTPTACRLVISSLSLPADRKSDSRWAIDAQQTMNEKKTIAITVPTESTKSKFHLLVLTRAEAEKALLRIHYAKPDYGGDIYFVPLGRFLTDEKPPIRN